MQTRIPKTLNTLAAAPLFAAGANAELFALARAAFAKNNMRQYSKLIWQLRHIGYTACTAIEAQATAALLATATEADVATAVVYDTLHGRARKRYGYRHRKALARAGARAASTNGAAAEAVWGKK